MKHGSLFSGIGGFDLAAEWMGWENVFHCEWNPFGQRILKYYWPNAISYEDITKTDFSIHRGAIDILTGGFPCQPYSTAGKRLGKEDDRHLWPEMLRAIREIKPTWIVGENVRGLVTWNGGLVFEEVQADLEAEGYEVQPFLLPAAGVGAPHERYRIWFVAYANLKLRGGGTPGKNKTKEFKIQKRDYMEQFKESGSVRGFSPDASSIRHELPRKTWKWRSGFKDDNIGNNATDTNSNKRRERWMYPNGFKTPKRYIGARNARGKQRTTWQNFPTQPPVCNGNDGVSSGLDGITFPKWRNESIKGGGNAIVPQVVHQIFKAIEQYEAITKRTH